MYLFIHLFVYYLLEKKQDCAHSNIFLFGLSLICSACLENQGRGERCTFAPRVLDVFTEQWTSGRRAGVHSCMQPWWLMSAGRQESRRSEKRKKNKNKTIQRARLKRASSACAWMTPMRPIAPVEAVIQRLTVNTDWKSEPQQKREGVASLRSLLSEMCYDSKQMCVFLFAFQGFFFVRCQCQHFVLWADIRRERRSINRGQVNYWVKAQPCFSFFFFTRIVCASDCWKGGVVPNFLPGFPNHVHADRKLPVLLYKLFDIYFFSCFLWIS